MSATQPVLSVSNLSLSRGYRALLSGLSFEVCPGELWQLVGPNGSGKTTLLKALLAHPGMNRVAVIINEFGEIGLDHSLIESVDEDAVLLNSGCLCCTLRGDCWTP